MHDILYFINRVDRVKARMNNAHVTKIEHKNMLKRIHCYESIYYEPICSEFYCNSKFILNKKKFASCCSFVNRLGK